MTMTDPDAIQRPLAVLVGAGPGDERLVSLEGVHWLSLADTVIYDRLVNPGLLRWVPPAAERIYVGKGPGNHEMTQDQINELLVERCRQGRLVVRLKGGDPYIFGRGGEEAHALANAGLPFRIVPGITAAVAAGAYAGIPLTDRRLASSVAFVTGHEDPSKDASAINWPALAGIDTLVFYMGVGNLSAITERLMAAGKPADTLAAIIEQAATPRQKVVTATLATLPLEAERHNVKAPALIIVGQVVSLRPSLQWLEKLPLFGQTILVTRSRQQASELSEKLTHRGAEVIEAPTLDIHPPTTWDAVDDALRHLRQMNWLVLTSPNGVQFFFSRLAELGFDVRALGGIQIAAVGPGTAAALRQQGLIPDLVPETFTTDALGEAMWRAVDLRDKRVLLARADIATDDLPAALRAAGARVEEIAIYRTAQPPSLPQDALAALREERVRWITFTSSSTVDNFLALLDRRTLDLSKIKLAAIGPVTAAALARHGLTPSAIAAPHTIAGLVTAIEETVRHES